MPPKPIPERFRETLSEIHSTSSSSQRTAAVGTVGKLFNLLRKQQKSKGQDSGDGGGGGGGGGSRWTLSWTLRAKYRKGLAASELDDLDQVRIGILIDAAQRANFRVFAVRFTYMISGTPDPKDVKLIDRRLLSMDSHEIDWNSFAERQRLRDLEPPFDGFLDYRLQGGGGDDDDIGMLNNDYKEDPEYAEMEIEEVKERCLEMQCWEDLQEDVDMGEGSAVIYTSVEECPFFPAERLEELEYGTEWDEKSYDYDNDELERKSEDITVVVAWPADFHFAALKQIFSHRPAAAEVFMEGGISSAKDCLQLAEWIVETSTEHWQSGLLLRYCVNSGPMNLILPVLQRTWDPSPGVLLQLVERCEAEGCGALEYLGNRNLRLIFSYIGAGSFCTRVMPYLGLYEATERWCGVLGLFDDHRPTVLPFLAKVIDGYELPPPPPLPWSTKEGNEEYHLLTGLLRYCVQAGLHGQAGSMLQKMLAFTITTTQENEAQRYSLSVYFIKEVHGALCLAKVSCSQAPYMQFFWTCFNKRVFPCLENSIEKEPWMQEVKGIIKLFEDETFRMQLYDMMVARGLSLEARTPRPLRRKRDSRTAFDTPVSGADKGKRPQK